MEPVATRWIYAVVVFLVAVLLNVRVVADGSGYTACGFQGGLTTPLALGVVLTMVGLLLLWRVSRPGSWPSAWTKEFGLLTQVVAGAMATILAFSVLAASFLYAAAGVVACH